MNIIRDTSEQLRSMIRAAMEKAIAEGALKEAPLPEFVVEIPADTTKGDFATNAATDIVSTIFSALSRESLNTPSL